MNLVPIDVESLPFGQPLPFALRTKQGALLAEKGFVIRDSNARDALLLRSVVICVDTSETGDSHRAYLAQIQKMLISGTSLGQIASIHISAAAKVERNQNERRYADWLELQLKATQLLRSPNPQDFLPRIESLLDDLTFGVEHTPDASLLALLHMSTDSTEMYSATHSMLVSIVCMVVGKQILRWPREKLLQIGGAALTMNIAMTEQQDQLAQQSQPLSSKQIDLIEHHPARSEALLKELGVIDPVWLEAVLCHHHRSPGPMAKKTLAQQMARMIHRCDTFAARLAPRANRIPMPVTAAMQASYFDEDKNVDEAGAAMIKALGIYPPGAYVKLASNEIAVVIKRGPTAATPKVAVVLNREGMPTGQLITRDTIQPAYKIAGVISRKETRVQIPLERLLAAQ